MLEHIDALIAAIRRYRDRAAPDAMAVPAAAVVDGLSIRPASPSAPSSRVS
jgi:hypothetical protein